MKNIWYSNLKAVILVSLLFNGHEILSTDAARDGFKEQGRITIAQNGLIALAILGVCALAGHRIAKSIQSKDNKKSKADPMTEAEATTDPLCNEIRNILTLKQEQIANLSSNQEVFRILLIGRFMDLNGNGAFSAWYNRGVAILNPMKLAPGQIDNILTYNISFDGLKFEKLERAVNFFNAK